MTTAIFTRQIEYGTLTMTLDITGHAEDSASCNYIVGIAFALAGYLRNAEREGRCDKAAIDIGEDAPRMTISAEGARLDVQQCYRMAMIGLLQLEHDHPEAIRVAHNGFN